MKCRICEVEDESVDKNNPTCDGCWYGMRLCTDKWLKEMKAKGIEVKRGIGCSRLPGGSFLCGDPYQAVTEPEV